MKVKMIALSLFISGAGTKLLQSQIGNSDKIMTLPSYPLLYFYPHWEIWSNKYKKLNTKKIYNLIVKHHASVIDSKKIPGFNGLNNLGKSRNKSIQVSKQKFKKFFFLFLKKKEINSKNTLLAIHYAFHKAGGKSFKNVKYILFHVHNYEYFKKYLVKDFPDSKLILITRNPIENFWRRAFTNDQIEKDRYDFSDKEYLKNFSYLNLLEQIFLDVLYLDKNLINKNNVKIITFEKLKTKNEITLKNLCKFLKIDFKKKHLTPRFLGFEWWSHKNYKGYNSNKIFEPKLNLDPKDKNKFFYYEIIALEILFRAFFKKFKYKSSVNFYNFILFPLMILLPTKYGINLFLTRLSIFSFLRYIENSYNECFNKKLKDYYFNAMYKFKYLYRRKIFINWNILRKFIFINNNQSTINILSLLLFILKILSYPYFILEAFLLYFVRIYKIFKYFVLINILKKQIIKKLKVN